MACQYDYQKHCNDKIIDSYEIWNHNSEKYEPIETDINNENMTLFPETLVLKMKKPGETGTYEIKIVANPDCCDISWFYFYEDKSLDSIIGKTIAKIDMTEEEVELPMANLNECDKNVVVRITFTDSSNYEFVFRNSSNGYYSGYLSIE